MRNLQGNVRGVQRRQGRSTPALRCVLRHRFYLGPKYHAMLITGLATVDNPKACFRSGMCLVFGKQCGAIMPCLDPLRRAVEAGHKVAIYALALLLYRPNSGDGDDDEARWLLRMVEGPELGALALPWNNKTCTKCHSRIISALWDLASLAVGVPTPMHRQDEHQCAGGGCGEHAGWYAWYSWHRFCSEECRIGNECDWFFYIVMETLNEKKLPGKNPHDSTKCKRPTSQCRNFSYLKLQLNRPNFMCTSVV